MALFWPAIRHDGMRLRVEFGHSGLLYSEDHQASHLAVTIGPALYESVADLGVRQLRSSSFERRFRCLERVGEERRTEHDFPPDTTAGRRVV